MRMSPLLFRAFLWVLETPGWSPSPSVSHSRVFMVWPVGTPPNTCSLAFYTRQKPLPQVCVCLCPWAFAQAHPVPGGMNDPTLRVDTRLWTWPPFRNFCCFLMTYFGIHLPNHTASSPRVDAQSWGLQSPYLLSSAEPVLVDFQLSDSRHNVVISLPP